LLGSALVDKLTAAGFANLILRRRDELDLRDQGRVKQFFVQEQPDYVFLTAGRVGGILANQTNSAQIFHDTLSIESNIINSASEQAVTKLLYVGCSCVYPKNAPQPIKEEYLLQGPFEPTSEMFSIAKLSGLKMCQAYAQQGQSNFSTCVCENLFGPHDNFDLATGHVVPALIKKMHLAKLKNKPEALLWGSGKPKRSFIYSRDAAEALIFLMQNYDSSEIINVGANLEVSIAELAGLIKKVVGFQGKIVFDASRPDGVARKILNIQHFLKLGGKVGSSLEQGLRNTYQWFMAQGDSPSADH